MSDSRRVELEPAFILHQRDFRNTSKIFDLYTASEGRISVIAKGVRSARSANKGLLQAFQPLRISWTGKNELKTLTGVEPTHNWPLLQGTNLMCGFYVNELTMKLAPTEQADPELFVAYHDAISSLADGSLHATMRRFELKLLASIGHGLNLLIDAESGADVEPDKNYIYLLQTGPKQATSILLDTGMGIEITGSQLQAMAQFDFSQRDVMSVAAKITRNELNHYLGHNPLKSRQVLMSMLKRETHGS